MVASRRADAIFTGDRTPEREKFPIYRDAVLARQRVGLFTRAGAEMPTTGTSGRFAG